MPRPHTPSQAQPAQQIILGIDPSLRGTGYGVIDTAQATPATLSQGTIRCPADWRLSRCLREITETLEDILQKTKPTIAAVEGLFFAQNIRTALVMGQARGAALAALAKAGLDVFEIAPRKVKQAIVGYGAAQKEAVAKMVQTRLALPELPDARRRRRTCHRPHLRPIRQLPNPRPIHQAGVAPAPGLSAGGVLKLFRDCPDCTAPVASLAGAT